MPAFDPSDWVDLVAYAIISVPTTIAAVAAYRKARDAHYEVTIDHESNIRNDIDDLRETVKEGFAEMREEFRAVRQELNTERIERIEGDKLRLVPNGR